MPQIAPKPEQQTSAQLGKRLGAIITHPQRLMAWVIINESPEPRSPAELAPLMGVALSRVAYHVRELARYNCVELAYTRQVRGATEHFYRVVRAPYVSDEDWKTLGVEERAEISLGTVQLHLADVSIALAASTFDSRVERCLIRTPLKVDEKGFSELNELEERNYKERLDIEARSERRLRRDESARAIPVASATMFFEMPEPGWITSGLPEGS